MARPKLASVIVPARDSERTLGAALAGLAAQDYGGAWEAIVVDNGSSDATPEVARRGLARLPAGRLLEAGERRGAGPARNAGAAAARGDLLVFLDADDVPEPGWLTALVRAADDSELVAGALRVDALNDGSPRAGFRIPPADRAPVAHGFLPFAYGGNCGVWTRVFDAVGGFDEEFRFGQDVDLCWRVQLAGSELGFAADAIVQRRVRSGAAAVLVQHVRIGIATVHLYSRYHSAGMSASSPGRALLSWVALIAASPVAALIRSVRAEWLMRLGLRVGRVAGSFRYRTFYP